MLVRIAIRLKKQSGLGLSYLSLLSWQASSVQILEHLLY